MAHFAQIDAGGIVVRVVSVANAVLMDNGVESEQRGVTFLQSLYGGDWVQTSYNRTRRKHFAGVGYRYDSSRDAFIQPRPYQSWTLDESTCTWKPPVPAPNDGKPHAWDEAGQRWV